jgi:hypothetical protein
MPRDTTSAASAPHWYLIALNGDMVLKLADSLVVGEDALGELVINPARSSGLLRLSVSGDELEAQVLAMDMTLAQRGYPSSQHIGFRQPAWVKLALPNNSLVISPEFGAPTAARYDRELRLVPVASPTITLERLPDPIVLREPGVEIPTLQPEGLPDDIMELIGAPEPADDALLHGATAELPAETVEGAAPETDEGREAPGADIRAPATAGAAAAEGAPAAGAGARRSSALRWTTASVAILVALLALVLPHSRPADAPVPLPQPDPTAAAGDAIADDPAGDTPGDPTVARSDSGPAGEPQAPEPFEPLLREAVALLERGAIVTPGRENAVRIALDVLAADPDNAGAAELLDACALRLVEQARALYREGNHFEARNLLEDVEGFHPGYGPALELLSAWSAPSPETAGEPPGGPP